MKKNLSVISDQPPGKTDKTISIAALQIRQLLFARSFKILATLALLVVSVLTNFANAQTPLYFKTGTGTSGNTIPLNQASQKTQLLYAPGDFSTLPISGNITKIYFRNSTAGAFATYTDFKVSFIQNSLASFPSSSYLTGLTLAHSVTTQSVTANATAGGWFEIPLNAPYFQYDNTQTLVIEIQYTAKTDGISTTTSTSIGNKRISGTSLTATTGTVNTIWNDFGMTVIPSTPCAGLPNAGTAISSATVVCPNVNFQLSLTGNTSASGLTYQWQSSPNGTTWTDITGATNPFLTTSQTATTQYRAQVTCSGQTASSASVTVNTNSAPVSGTFTINKTLPASGTNFQSFAAAVTSLQCGGISGPVTFNVVSGTGPYLEHVTIPVIPGVSATNTLTFNGNGNTLRGTASTGTPVMKLDGADYIRVNNLVIEAEGSATAGQVIHLTNGADNNVFTGNTFKHNTTSTATSHVIYIYTGSNNNNTFTGNNIIGAYYGVYNYGTSATAAQSNNRFLNNIFKDQYYYGFYNYYGTNTTLEGNDISRPTRTNSTTMYMVYMSTGSTGFTISKNRLHNTHDAATTTTGTVYGIYSSAAGTGVGSENLVQNNAIYNINNNGGTLYAIYNTGGNNTHYYYNTISADLQNVSYTTLRGMYFLSASTNVKFINNNISLSSNATTAKHALYLGSTTITLQSNNNNLYAPGGNVGYYSANRITLADWKAANSAAYDQASVSADPIYSGLLAGNLKPTSVALNDKGQVVSSVTTDINGLTRSTTTPDPGAYEFSINPNDVGVSAITGVSSGCGLTSTQLVTITVKNFGSAPQSNIPVNFMVGGAIIGTGIVPGPVAPNGTATFTFTATANLGAPGPYTVIAKTLMTGDADASNDSFTLNVTNSLIPTLPIALNFETPATGIGAVQVVTNSKSTIVEAAGASNGTGSTKGMIMAGVTASNWVLPVGVIDPWTNNGDQFSAIKMCINPTSGPAKDSLFLLFDLKQLFKVANANTNLRVTVNGQQVGPTYRPPFSGTPIVWQRIRVDLTPYKHLPNVEIALESSVKEEYAGGAGTANLIDNMILSRRTTGLKSDILQSLTAVYPNPSTGIFNVTAPNGNFTMEVTDMTGKTILKQNANGATSQLNLQKAAKGIYLLKITSEGSIATQRLVIQ